MQKIAKKLPNKHDYLYKTTLINFASATSPPPPPRETRPQTHIMFTMFIRVFGLSCVFFHGGMMSHQIIPILVDYIVQNGQFDPQNLIDYLTFRNIFAIYWGSIIKQLKKKANTFCINQKVTFGADVGAYFLSKRDSSFTSEWSQH